MRILVIGGTQFVGRHFVESALAAGHDVTLLHRGDKAPDLFTQAEHRHADRNGDLSLLSTSDWDATVDFCAYLPDQVSRLAEALGGRGGHHVFISTVSVYAEAQRPGGREKDLRLLDAADPSVREVTNETYGPLKVACEQVASAAYGNALTIVRPTYVVGPWDPTGRFPWWVLRIERGGEVLAPGPADAPMQVIDARDQADWIVRLCEQQTSGAFHAASPTPPFSMGDLLEATAAAVAPADTSLRWVPSEWLLEQNENGMTLPLWTEGAPEWVLAIDPAAAYETGLQPRPVTDTVRDIAAWAQGRDDVLREGWGISPEREAELLKTRPGG